MQQTLRKVAVIGGVRTPFCRGNTGYDEQTNLDLMMAALNGLVAKYHLDGEHIDEVVGGAVVTHAKDFNLTREAVIGTRLREDTPGVTLSQACGTSLQAALGSAAKIAIGQIDCAIATGSDTVSDPPIELKRQFAKRLARTGAEKSITKKASTFLSGFSLGDLAPNPPANAEPRTGLSMGQHCELMAKEWQISREDQDQLAYESHRKAAAAYDQGFLDDLLVPSFGVFRDNNLRADIDLAKIAQLRPAFDRESGTLTAANSTPLTDGASAVLLASEEWAKARGLKPLAYLTHGQHYAIDFVDGAKGLLMAPTIAVSKMLDQAGLTLQDFDFYEIHEAFAAQVLCTLKAWEDPEYCKTMLGKDKPLGAIDRAKMNVKGSSLAYGHPFAATGGRIIATLAKILEENGGGRGLISICTAGGMGVCAILEAPRATNGSGERTTVRSEAVATAVSMPQTAPMPEPAASISEREASIEAAPMPMPESSTSRPQSPAPLSNTVEAIGEKAGRLSDPRLMPEEAVSETAAPIPPSAPMSQTVASMPYTAETVSEVAASMPLPSASVLRSQAGIPSATPMSERAASIPETAAELPKTASSAPEMAETLREKTASLSSASFEEPMVPSPQSERPMETAASNPVADQLAAEHGGPEDASQEHVLDPSVPLDVTVQLAPSESHEDAGAPGPNAEVADQLATVHVAETPPPGETALPSSTPEASMPSHGGNQGEH